MNSIMLTPTYGTANPYDPLPLFEKLHTYAESIHNCTGAGQGTWESANGDKIAPPSLRMICHWTQMYLDLGYGDLHINRIHQACEYLLTQQQTDGRFESTSTISPASTIDDTFDTAECGVILWQGWKRFDIPAYQEAVLRAVDWILTGQVVATNTDPEYYLLHPNDPPYKQLMAFMNANFTGSMLRLLCLIERDGVLLDGNATAIEEMATALASWQQADGTWFWYGNYPDGVSAGSNIKKIVYHELALTGLVGAIAVTGSAVIESAVYKAVNYLIQQQRYGGLLLSEAGTQTLVPLGGRAMAAVLTQWLVEPDNQARGSNFLNALGKGMDTIAINGVGKYGMEQRMMVLRSIVGISQWTKYYNR